MVLLDAVLRAAERLRRFFNTHTTPFPENKYLALSFRKRLQGSGYLAAQFPGDKFHFGGGYIIIAPIRIPSMPRLHHRLSKTGRLMTAAYACPVQ